MPGGVDEHVHYGSFGGRLFETAEAAAAGGTTTIVDFAPQEKDVPLLDAIRRQAAKAEHTSSVDFAFHAVIMDPKESVFEEVRHLPEVGVATLKLFMAYKGTAFYCDDEAILSAMMNAKDAGVTMMVHAENADIITILTRYYLSQGKTAPVYHYYARPPIAEALPWQKQRTAPFLWFMSAYGKPWRPSGMLTMTAGPFSGKPVPII